MCFFYTLVKVYISNTIFHFYHIVVPNNWERGERGNKEGEKIAFDLILFWVFRIIKLCFWIENEFMKISKMLFWVFFLKKNLS
jgi:hypothetical protein